MKDYTSIINLLKSDHYADRTDCFGSFIWRRYSSLTGCLETGSSLFLKTLACFLDEALDTKLVFQNLKIGKSEFFLKEINSYRVVFLDLADFEADNFEDAMAYMKVKMSDLYKYYHKNFEPDGGGFFYPDTYDSALDIIEGIASTKVLQGSLKTLLIQLRGYESHKKGSKLAVLIDNMARLETIASEKGYSDQMNTFLKDYVVQDVYKYCDLFLQVSDVKEDKDPWGYIDRYLVHSYFNVSPFDIRWQHGDVIVEKEKQCYFDTILPFVDKTDWISYIAEGRKIVQRAKDKEKRERQEYIRWEKNRYAEKLSSEVPLWSPNMGIRTKALDKTSPQYVRQNTLLRDIYTKFCPDFKADDIYRYFQKFNEGKKIVSKTDELEILLEQLPAGNHKWKEKGSTNCWSCWVQVQYTSLNDERCSSPGKAANIKAYACLKDVDVQQVFVDSLRYLLQNASKTFGAKLSTISRSDMMCYWLSAKDFVHLEQFFKPYNHVMNKSMPFVAYKGKLGISREFPGADNSHNSTQAHIISDYFRTVDKAEDVDLEDMYNYYIKKWNADIYEEGYYSGFKGNSALSFAVIMDTLDAILNGNDISDESLLMSGDSKIWNILSISKCWADVNEKWLSTKQFF